MFMMLDAAGGAVISVMKFFAIVIPVVGLIAYCSKPDVSHLTPEQLAKRTAVLEQYRADMDAAAAKKDAALANHAKPR